MKSERLLIAGFFAVTSLGGCGRYADVDADTQANEPLSCDLPSTPCGGNVVGTWDVVDCPLELTGQVDVTGFGLGCSTGTTLSGSLTVSGTWKADGTGNVRDDTLTQGSHQFELSAACLEVGIPGCDAIARPLKNVFGYATVECLDNPDTGDCLCTGTFNQKGGLATFTSDPPLTARYTVADSTLTTVDRGVETTFEYCAMDDALVLTPTTEGKLGKLVGSLVLQRE